MPESLINFWQRFDCSKPPYVHPDDMQVLRTSRAANLDEEPQNFDAFISGARFGNFKDKKFHLSLLPVPYSGNLRTADIIVLLLNPGCDTSDYFAEYKMPGLRDRLRLDLTQDLSGARFPFMWLDPEYCWHGGFAWWERRLRGVITMIANAKFDGIYQDALRAVSNRLATVEMIPYHSRSFSAQNLVSSLPSAVAARTFVQGALADAAIAGDKIIIVTRQVNSWKLPDNNDNIVLYKGGHTRGASLGPDSEGGRKILDRFAISI